MSKPIGLYVHVPFCASKCPYCDFYSVTGQTDAVMDAYTGETVRLLRQWYEQLDGIPADTLYFGGGTPSLLGGKRLSIILEAAASCYGLENAEITMEANPGDDLTRVFSDFAAAGGNRISIGMQAANAKQLDFLGRRHGPEDVKAAVDAAHAAGIDNISLDLMLGLQGQSVKSVVAAASEAYRLGARHASAYLLKIEEGTPFYARQPSLELPDEDAVSELYLAACETLEMLGYDQYEISNFAVPGFESRHNLKYWNADPYLGIGPAAHSFLGDRRFYYPRDLNAFLNGSFPKPEREEEAPYRIEDAGEEEYIMLRLRLSEGVVYSDFQERFGRPVPAHITAHAGKLPAQLVTTDEKGIRLTRMGFLLSNTLITCILEYYSVDNTDITLA